MKCTLVIIALVAGAQADDGIKAVDWPGLFAVADKGMNASLGDTLRFSWSGGHNVYLMASEPAWESCDFTGATEVGQVAPLDYTIPDSTSVGSKLWFACQVGNHCDSGLKLVVDLVGTGTTTDTSTTTSGTTTPEASTTTMAADIPAVSTSASVAAEITAASTSAADNSTAGTADEEAGSAFDYKTLIITALVLIGQCLLSE